MAFLFGFISGLLMFIKNEGIILAVLLITLGVLHVSWEYRRPMTGYSKFVLKTIGFFLRVP